MDDCYAIVFILVLISSHLFVYWRSGVPCPEIHKPPETMEIINDFHGLVHLTHKLSDTLSDQALKEKAESVTKEVLDLFKKINSTGQTNTTEFHRALIEREAKLRVDEAKFTEEKEAFEKSRKEWVVPKKVQKSILRGKKVKLEEDIKSVDAIHNYNEEKKKLKEEQRILAIEKDRMMTKELEVEKQRIRLNDEKAAFEKESETKRKKLMEWETGLAKREEAYEQGVKEVQTRKAELNGKETKIDKDKVQFHGKKEKAIGILRNVFLTIVVGAVVIAVCICRTTSRRGEDINRTPERRGGGDGVRRTPERRGGGGGVHRTPERQVSANASAELDICHISLTRERNAFFEDVLLPRLAESNIRPRTQCCLLSQPADFDDIPPARCYIVHWTSHRMSFYSTRWHHQGLLRALGDSPVMIIIFDSEELSTLPEPKIYDDAFRQIETERELHEAASERRLMTYRGNEQFNQTQNQTLRNWVNANIGEDI